MVALAGVRDVDNGIWRLRSVDASVDHSSNEQQKHGERDDIPPVLSDEAHGILL